MKGLVFDTENRMQFKNFGEPLLDSSRKKSAATSRWFIPSICRKASAWW